MPATVAEAMRRVYRDGAPDAGCLCLRKGKQTVDRSETRSAVHFIRAGIRHVRLYDMGRQPRLLEGPKQCTGV